MMVFSARGNLISCYALLATIALFYNPLQALAVSDEVIRHKASQSEVQSHKYLAAAEVFGDVANLVKRFKSVDYKEHECNLLAERLGIETQVAENPVRSDPSLDSSDAVLLVLYVQSLRNYSLAVKSVIDLSEFSLLYRWNLYCAERQEPSVFFQTDHIADVEWNVAEGGSVLELVGDIIPDLMDEIQAELNANQRISTIRLASRGGSVEEAIKIGRLVRERRLNTEISGDCDSSCSLIMIGGIRRNIPPPFYTIGFHRISISGKTVPDDYDDYEKIRQYANEMIGTGDEIVAAWKSGEGSNFYRPSGYRLCQIRVVTENC